MSSTKNTGTVRLKKSGVNVPTYICDLFNYYVIQGSSLRVKGGNMDNFWTFFLISPERHMLWARLLILTFPRSASSPRLLEIGMLFQILSFLLLKVQKILLLSLFVCQSYRLISLITSHGE